MTTQTHIITEVIQRVLGWALVSLSLFNFHFAGLAGAQPIPRPATTDTRQIILAWLECGICSKDEIQAVKSIGSSAVPSLEVALIGGPSEGDLELKKAQLRTFHEGINARDLGPGRSTLSENQERFIKTYEANYVALYKIRAAQALGAIATDQAKQALEKGKTQPNPRDVDRAIDEALRNIP